MVELLQLQWRLIPQRLNDIKLHGIDKTATLYPGVGSAQAVNKTVTNDINSVNELHEEKTVGIAVSTSQVITV